MPSTLDTSNLFPWKDIRDVRIAGQEMVFIPKVYVKTMSVNGYPAYFVCGTQKNGYHLHPAFMNNGRPTDNGILIGKYAMSGSTTTPLIANSIKGEALRQGYRDKMFAAINSRNVTNGSDEQTGWHPYNICEHHLILRLALIEYASANLTSITEYHGICNYENDYPFWLDGLGATYAADSTFRWIIMNNLGTQTVETSAERVCGTYYTVEMSVAKGDTYDTGDVFLSKVTASNSKAGNFGLAQNVAALKAGVVTYNFFSSRLTFYLRGVLPTATTTCYSRIAKFC